MPHNIPSVRRILLSNSSLELDQVVDRIGDDFLLIESTTEEDSQQLLIPVRLVSIESLEEMCNNILIGFYHFIGLTEQSDKVSKNCEDYNKTWWLFEPDHFIKRFYNDDDIFR